MKLRALTFLAALCVASPMQAQTIEKALEGIPPAGGSCRQEDAVVQPIGPSRKLAEPELACAMTTQELASIAGKPETLILDTRAPADFTEFHIDAALNMPWSRARSNPLFKTRSLVLVGSGKAERDLYVGCAELRALGFVKVSVLRGGMAAWAADEQRVVGRAPVDTFAILDSEEFLAESGFAANRVVALPVAAALKKQVPSAEVLGGAGAQHLKSWSQARKQEPINAVVLVTGATLPPERLRPYAQSVHPLTLLVYPETPAAYAAWLRQKKAVWAAQARGPAQMPCSVR